MACALIIGISQTSRNRIVSLHGVGGRCVSSNREFVQDVFRHGSLRNKSGRGGYTYPISNQKIKEHV
jgi:hypothetical protein